MNGGLEELVRQTELFMLEARARKKNESLVDRIREEYCIEGSWKRDLINDALKRGYELWFRYNLTETRGVACAEDHENSLLAQFDYAWNTRNILP